MSLGEVVRVAAARYGDTPVYVTKEKGVLSYAQLDRLSDSVAAGLAERGIRVGDVVAMLLGSGPEYAVAYAAAAKLGAVTAGVNDRLSSIERSRCLAVVRPRLVIAPAGANPLSGGRDASTLTDSCEIVEVDTEVAHEEMLGELRATSEVPELEEDPERAVAIVFTSGTTGTPKGAVFGGRQLDAVSQADGMMRWGAGGRQLSTTPFSHVGYMTKLPQAIRSGGTTYVMKRWNATEALELAERHRVTTLGGIPTQMELMLRHEGFSGADLSSVKLVVLGGGPSTAALVREARERLGVPVVVRYTCTEAGVGTGTDPDGPPEDAEQTVGRARHGVEVTVRDESDRALGVGEVGQVCLRSAGVMSGYYLDPDATAAAVTTDGAVRTGDVGFLDDRGRLHLTGRSKEMYVRGGYNVYPLEVEAALVDHPQVAHVAVSPRRDSLMGEIGVAIVVVRQGSDAPSLESLREHARGRLASYKLPEDVVVVPELPRTPVEKIDRRALADLVRKGQSNLAGSEPVDESGGDGREGAAGAGGAAAEEPSR